MRQRRRIPSICYHKGASRYYVALDGKQHYLGETMPKETVPPKAIHDEYERLLGPWLADRSTSLGPVGPDPTIDELWLGYFSLVTNGKKYHKHGKPTSEVELIRIACSACARLFGELPAREFGPLKLETVRAEFVNRGWTRESINKATHRVKRMFRWGVSRELLPESIHRSLQTLADLTETEHAHGNKEIGDVADWAIEATARRLPANLAAMIHAHRLIGCRAQEIVVARTCDFDIGVDADNVPDSERCWLFSPTESKTDENYWVGPKAQAILRPWFHLDEREAWLFPTRRRGRGCWTTASYRRAITRTIAVTNARLERLNTHRLSRGKTAIPLLPYWTPINLRHAAAEEARRLHHRGIEATQARLRHKRADVSQLYAHNLDALGKDVARKFG